MAKSKEPGAGFKGQIFLVFTIITAAVFLPTTTMLFIGLMPAIAAAVVERSKRKTRAVTVFAMNLAGCMPFLFELWRQGDSFHKAISIISDPMAIVVIYSAAAMGYLIDWSIAGIVASILYQKGLGRQKAIRARQKELTERWGPEVTGDIPLDEQGFPLQTAAARKQG